MAKKAEAHHGGAWKVAYADFVTAMMALFMVLWICAQDKKILLATSKYFKQPFNALTDRSVGVMQGKESGSKGKEQTQDTATAANLAFLNALASELSRMLNVHDVMEEKQVDLKVTSDGLKVTLYDRTKQPIFKKGTAEVTEWGKLVMQNLAWIIERNELKVFIDGHAAAEAGSGSDGGSDALWNLTTDRANAARRLLVKYAVKPAKIERVTGYADTKPLPRTEPDAPTNERITVSLSPQR
jgi:chemotaxis protein MotB